jgi:integrase
MRVLNAEYQKVLNEAQFGVKQEITIRDAMERTCSSVKDKTAVIYRGCMNSILGLGYYAEEASRWSLDGSRGMSSLKQRDLNDHRLSRANETTRRGTPMSNNSINIEVRFLRTVYNFVKDDFAVPPSLRFQQAEAFEKTRYIREDEEKAILRLLSAPVSPRAGEAYVKAHDLYLTLVDTGISLSEGVHLRRNQFNRKRLHLEIRRAKTKTPCLVPVSERVLEVLERRGRSHNHSTFFTEMTRAVRILREIIGDVCNQDEREVEELGAATIHSLRDTFATRRLAEGFSLYDVSKLLGHANTTMTKKYAHLETADVVEKVRQRMNERSAM